MHDVRVSGARCRIKSVWCREIVTFIYMFFSHVHIPWVCPVNCWLGGSLWLWWLWIDLKSAVLAENPKLRFVVGECLPCTRLQDCISFVPVVPGTEGWSQWYRVADGSWWHPGKLQQLAVALEVVPLLESLSRRHKHLNNTASAMALRCTPQVHQSSENFWHVRKCQLLLIKCYMIKRMFYLLQTWVPLLVIMKV